MQYKVGEPTFLDGEWNDVKTQIYQMSGRLQKHCKSILLIDTMNTVNPHKFAYNHARQQDIFNDLYFFRAKTPQELLARINTLEDFIKVKKVEAIIISSLSLVFSESDQTTIETFVPKIMEKLTHAAKKHNLAVIIGNSPGWNDKSTIAYELLQKKQVVV